MWNSHFHITLILLGNPAQPSCTLAQEFGNETIKHKKSYRLCTVFPFWWRVFNPTTILGHPGPFMRWLQLPLAKQNLFLLYQKQEGDRWLLPWAAFHSFNESVALLQLLIWGKQRRWTQINLPFPPLWSALPLQKAILLCATWKSFSNSPFHRNNQAFLLVHLHPLASKRLK